MSAPGGAIQSEATLWLLGSLCSLYRIPFDPKLVEQDFPPPHSLATFHEAARALQRQRPKGVSGPKGSETFRFLT
ncbi:hypothetical protein [Dechloromonas denitrificans]|uniref:hypothetical protein n=1 Tax=Dechloromonas denitrificans TaxID=281362 RepID=UPI001CFB8F10|nr:hypothetical protein [Dechloromonas denitrificans]UCV07645.1 hypothetical protein KI615_20045 [Dechloromonas denitrificans]